MCPYCNCCSHQIVYSLLDPQSPIWQSGRIHFQNLFQFKQEDICVCILHELRDKPMDPEDDLFIKAKFGMIPWKFCRIIKSIHTHFQFYFPRRERVVATTRNLLESCSCKETNLKNLGSNMLLLIQVSIILGICISLFVTLLIYGQDLAHYCDGQTRAVNGHRLTLLKCGTNGGFGRSEIRDLLLYGSRMVLYQEKNLMVEFEQYHSRWISSNKPSKSADNNCSCKPSTNNSNYSTSHNNSSTNRCSNYTTSNNYYNSKSMAFLSMAPTVSLSRFACQDDFNN